MGSPSDPELGIDPTKLIEQAEAKRTEGNNYFRTGDMKTAHTKYDETLKLLRREAVLKIDDESFSNQARAGRLATLLNIALCCLRFDPCDAHCALQYCEEALDIDPSNAKAMYRKAKALVELGEFQEAEFEYARACKAAPDDAAVRKELDQLRRRLREEKDQEKQHYAGFFEKLPGFASADRGALETGANAKVSNPGYPWLRPPNSNPHFNEGISEAIAAEFVSKGMFEDAVLAYEATLQRNPRQPWSLWIELGRLFMDLNVDALALRCFNEIAGLNADGQVADVPSKVLCNALLLKAICLLNEAEVDAGTEVSECLRDWLRELDFVVDVDSPQGVESKIRELVVSGASPLADFHIAQGLLHLLSGRDEAVGSFVAALLAEPDEAVFFACNSRLPTRWNMLGAVLANRGRYKEARTAYSQALRLQPRYPRSLVNNGIALEASAQLELACETYLTALELLPSWSALSVWAMLRKAATDHVGADGSIAEAANKKNTARLRELLPPQPLGSDCGVRETLDRIGLLPTDA